jgi:phage terminase small subunit
MGNEPLRKPKHEAFARHLAEGKSKREAAILAGYAEKHASSFGNYLSKNLQISQRVAFLQGQVADNAVQLVCKDLELTVRSKAKRVEIYEDVHERFWQIIKARAADPAMENVPGGRSGMLVKQVK